MKKILVVLFFMVNVLFATPENEINIVKRVIQEQDLLANSIDTYVSLYGTAPGNLTVLQNADLISDIFSTTATFTVNTTDKSIVVTTNIASATTIQRDYFLNNNNRDKLAVASISGDNFISTYMFSHEASFSSIANASMNVSPTAPTSPSSGNVWLDSTTRLHYYYDGSQWRSLNVKRLWIVRSTGELTTTADINDGAILVDTTKTEKYIYSGTAWFKIPQNIPFTYNGTF